MGWLPGRDGGRKGGEGDGDGLLVRSAGWLCISFFWAPLVWLGGVYLSLYAISCVCRGLRVDWRPIKVKPKMLISPCLVQKKFIQYLSHQIFGHVLRALNTVKKIN